MAWTLSVVFIVLLTVVEAFVKPSPFLHGSPDLVGEIKKQMEYCNTVCQMLS